jgi:manganese/iron transport system permease protein
VRAVGTILVVALLIVPAAAARMLTSRLWVMSGIGTALILLAGYGGLLASWTASVDYGISLTSASAVVLLLVLAYLLLLPVGMLRVRRDRTRPVPPVRRSPHELVG